MEYRIGAKSRRIGASILQTCSIAKQQLNFRSVCSKKAEVVSSVSLILYQDKEVVHFNDWNAHSIYFYDPAGNIVELIARHNMNNSTNESFSQASLLCVSEVGIPVSNVEDAIFKLSQKGMYPWQEYNNNFAAIGNEQGLLIAVSEGRVWFMSDKKSYPYNLTIKTDICTVTLDDSNGMNVIGPIVDRLSIER